MALHQGAILPNLFASVWGKNTYSFIVEVLYGYKRSDKRRAKGTGGTFGNFFSEKERTEVLKQKIKVALGDVDDREEVFAHKATARDEERISIVLNESDTDKQPVQVGVKRTAICDKKRRKGFSSDERY